MIHLKNKYLTKTEFKIINKSTKIIIIIIKTYES